MSMSDSDSSYGGAEYKNFRQITRDRLLYEMLRSTKVKDSKVTWKVLIMDKLTVKIMSNSCKMADVTVEGVSLVEDLHKRRQPMPAMDAIYFMQPLKENVTTFLSDMSGKSPLYKKAYVFFSSPISRELVAHVKNDRSVLPRIGALSEMNLEYFAIDGQGFVTDHERALEELFAENAENSRKYDACLNTMATRIATVFASLKEFPYVRYRAAKSSLDASTMTTLRDLVPTKLAAGIWNCLARYKTTIPDFPQRETCELLIVDRSVDQIAPIIHEWTYDAMCHDLLNMEGNKYVHEVLSKSGTVEKKEVLLEDHDPIWLELRHAHIGDASERLHEKMANFVSRNKAAQIHNSSDIIDEEIRKTFLKERQTNGDFISKVSDMLWIRDMPKFADMETNSLQENLQQLDEMADKESTDGGFLKLTKTNEWVSGDSVIAPVNKKLAAKDRQNDIERRKKLNFLRYEAIKRELLFLTIGIGTGCCAYCLIVFSMEAAVSYAAGVLFSCLYLQLLYYHADNLSREAIPNIFLQKKVKKIGIRSEDLKNTLEKIFWGSTMALSSPRLVIPAALYGICILSQHILNNFEFQIVPAMFGFFAYKAAALVQVYRDNEDLRLIFPESEE